MDGWPAAISLPHDSELPCALVRLYDSTGHIDYLFVSDNQFD